MHPQLYSKRSFDNKGILIGVPPLPSRSPSVRIFSMLNLGVSKTVCVLIALLASAGAALANPIGLPGIDYDLASIVGSQTVYDPGSGVVTTTGTKAKLLLPAMTASPPDELRYVEVELTPSVAVTVQANWWNLSPRVLTSSDEVSVAAGGTETIALNLSTMNASDGTVKLKIKGSAAGTVISRVRLVEVPKPNIVFILVDDLSELELELGFGRSLGAWTPAIDTRLQDKATVFENFFNTTPLCCPSRASYLTGKYAHNHGIYGNNYNTTGGNGGWRRFWELGHELDSLGVWMQDAGYHTALIGKFMNGYPNKPEAFVPETYVPAGWDEWYGEFNNDLPFSYHDFRLNENGTVVEIDDGTHLTDYESVLAVDYIDRVAPSGQPFFMFLTPFAPHGPTEPAFRHDGTHPDLEPVPPPSFNEADLSDKPQHIQDGATFTPEYFGPGSERKLDMTLSLDELIAAVFDALEAHGILDRTYVFFTSDNGLLRGEHGIGGKSAPYEESVSIPLIVRGPGVPEGVSRPDLVLNIDIAATLLELAGSTPPETIDGESIIELMTGATPSQDWRDAVQIELLTEIDSENQSHVIPPYFGIRTSWQCYVEYEPGDLELYDLARDPFQLGQRPPARQRGPPAGAPGAAGGAQRLLRAGLPRGFPSRLARRLGGLQLRLSRLHFRRHGFVRRQRYGGRIQLGFRGRHQRYRRLGGAQFRGRRRVSGDPHGQRQRRQPGPPGPDRHGQRAVGSHHPSLDAAQDRESGQSAGYRQGLRHRRSRQRRAGGDGRR